MLGGVPLLLGSPCEEGFLDAVGRVAIADVDGFRCRVGVGVVGEGNGVPRVARKYFWLHCICREAVILVTCLSTNHAS